MKKKKYAHQENLKEEAKDVVVRFINVWRRMEGRR
jgi:hypothetical protein